MGIRETIVEHFGEDDFVVQEMNKRGLEYGIMLAKTCIHKDNLSPTAKTIRYWSSPEVLERKSEAPRVTAPMKRLVLRKRSIPSYTAEEYCRGRPSLWRRIFWKAQ